MYVGQTVTVGFTPKQTVGRFVGWIPRGLQSMKAKKMGETLPKKFQHGKEEGVEGNKEAGLVGKSFES